MKSSVLCSFILYSSPWIILSSINRDLEYTITSLRILHTLQISKLTMNLEHHYYTNSFVMERYFYLIELLLVTSLPKASDTFNLMSAIVFCNYFCSSQGIIAIARKKAPIKTKKNKEIFV